MNFQTQMLVNKYLHLFNQTYSQDSAKSSDNYYTISPVRSSNLRRALLESVEFLQRVSVMNVQHPIGQVVVVGDPTLRTGRVEGGRFFKGSGLAGNSYELRETDSNCVIRWDQLAWWGNSGGANEFFQLMNSSAVINFALDMLRVGFNGVSAAKTTDATANPNGEDINIGWHQFVKNWAAANEKRTCRIMTSAVSIGEGGDYLSLDAAGADLVRCLPSQYQNDPRLIFLAGADLVASEEVRLLNKEDRPTENIAAQKLSKNIAGREAYIPPFFPGKRLVVTTAKNLQIMTLSGSQRRKAEDNGDRKQFENSYYRWEGYAVGDPECYAALDESAVTITQPGDKISKGAASARPVVKEPAATDLPVMTGSLEIDDKGIPHPVKSAPAAPATSAAKGG